MKHSYFLGIDGGGSKCKARLEDANGNLLAENISGPANPIRDYDLAMHSVNEAIAGVLSDANLNADALRETHAVIGLAGLNIPSCLLRMKSWAHPFKSLKLTTDLHIACVGAHGHDSGAIVIIGTGSSGIVCNSGQQSEYGGHGFLLGDKGSGAWFGAQAVRYALETIDGIKPSSPFIEKLLHELGCTTAHSIVDQYLQASPAKFAQLAPLVFEFAEQNECVAVQIVEDGARYITALCEQMKQAKPQRFSFIGGLSHKLIPWLDLGLQEYLSEPLNSPEVGAILIARQQHTAGKKQA